MYAADAAPPITDHQFCVLYDSETGKILSTYESITLEGAGLAPQQGDIETKARAVSKKLIETASNQRLDDKNIKAIFVGPEAFNASGPQKVDLKELRLVPAHDEAR